MIDRLNFLAGNPAGGGTAVTPWRERAIFNFCFEKISLKNQKRRNKNE
jgi:hypothetical protein